MRPRGSRRARRRTVRSPRTTPRPTAGRSAPHSMPPGRRRSSRRWHGGRSASASRRTRRDTRLHGAANAGRPAAAPRRVTSAARPRGRRCRRRPTRARPPSGFDDPYGFSRLWYRSGRCGTTDPASRSLPTAPLAQRGPQSGDGRHRDGLRVPAPGDGPSPTGAHGADAPASARSAAIGGGAIPSVQQMPCSRSLRNSGSRKSSTWPNDV